MYIIRCGWTRAVPVADMVGDETKGHGPGPRIVGRIGQGNSPMQASQEEITEKQLAEDFDRINDEVQRKLRDYRLLYPGAALDRDPDADDLVVEPVFAYDTHAVT